MLTSISIDTAFNLLPAFKDRGIRLVPKKTTLLNELVLSSCNEDSRQTMLAGQATVQHDAYMDNYIDDLTKLFSEHIAFARNTVKKNVVLFSEELQKTISRHKEIEPEEFFNVTYFSLPGIFNTELIQDELKNNSINSTFYETLPVAKLSLPEFNPIQYLLTEDEDIDTDLTEFLNTVGEARVMSFIKMSVNEIDLDLPDYIYYNLVNYIFYRNLLQKLDIQFGLTLNQLKVKANSNKSFFARKLLLSLDLYKSNIRQGTILSEKSNVKFSYLNKSEKLNIVIYQESFDVLVEKEVPIEAIFGFIAFENSTSINTNTLIAKKEEYVDKWNKIKSLYALSLNKDKLSTVRLLIAQAYDSVFYNMHEEDRKAHEFLGINSETYRQETHKLVNEYLDELTLLDLNDIEKIALTIIAKIHYRYSNAWDLLFDMKQMMDVDSKLDVKEAALYSCIRYLTKYLLSQTDVIAG